MIDLTERAGLPLFLEQGELVLGPDLVVEESGVRRLRELRDVAADRAAATGDRVQYWMYNGVARRADLPGVAGRPVRYELTALADRPIGRERPKSAGHVHSGIGFPEICEVLAGTAGFLVQDLRPGPGATYAALVTVEPGEWIVLPPFLHHATISLDGAPLVFGNLIARRSTADYAGVAAARGFAWLVDTDGIARPNPTYREVPPLERIDAVDWSGPSGDPLYRAFASDPASFDWLSGPDEFPTRAPALSDRLSRVLASVHGAG